MFDLFLDSLLDGLKDGAWSLPILFVAYLLMELLERSQKLNEEILHGYSHKAGPLLGGLLGVVPQCGISGAAATLFSTGSVTVGTMLAVFFATSDEMLPIMLSSVADGDIRLSSILLIVLGKAALGVALVAIRAALLRPFVVNSEGLLIYILLDAAAVKQLLPQNAWSVALPVYYLALAAFVLLSIRSFFRRKQSQLLRRPAKAQKHIRLSWNSGWKS